MEHDSSIFGADYLAGGMTGNSEAALLQGEFRFDGFLRDMMEAIPEYVMILSPEGRLLTANSRLLHDFDLQSLHIFGKRPGDILGCVNVSECPAGCMSGNHCSTCGAGISIAGTMERKTRVSNECRIISGKGGTASLDLEVTTTPLTINDMPVIFCVMKDISAEKRRKVLERVFFHDVMNTVSGICSLAELLAGEDEIPGEQRSTYNQWLVDLSGKLAEEINQQRRLLAAERGEFKPEMEPVMVRELMQAVHALYSSHTLARDRNLVLGEMPDVIIFSDGAILRRILGNLVKNALEAVPAGDNVTIYCRNTDEKITFYVHNPGVMPLDVQMQMFQRSFSTKAEEGRGTGTYSVKLFGERYLKGKVAFTSSEAEGTIFSFSLLLSPTDQAN